MGVLYYISYLAILAAFAFVTLSLASGLLYVSELIEEHARLAKTIGQRSIYAVIALHVLLYFTDNLPFLQTGFSILCHLVYLQNFSDTWPLIELTSIPFVASCLLVISDHFIWFYYFARLTSEARRLKTYRAAAPHVPGFTEIAAFFGLCVWLAPLFLFLSLSANDHALPTANGNDPTPGSPTATVSTHQRVSLIRSIFNLLSFDTLPRIRGRSTRNDTSEGLIAPRSPLPPPRPLSPLPSMPLSPMPRQYSGSGPPRSPMGRAQEIDVGSAIHSTNVKLRTPPRRATGDGPIMRRSATGDPSGLGLGIRRTSSFVTTDSQ
ncbi:hypothetical protein D9611_002571 [Ephemerocybe angulata]|uniref:DUF396-domain-containing protein n=1 Tax=Ephemerocybe angulata TaxID=980116 RepID=A0A8H5C278_9AGAR|nr:hypothetical protein D9611_002571 [Tulosesus angulatus]